MTRDFLRSVEELRVSRKFWFRCELAGDAAVILESYLVFAMRHMLSLGYHSSFLKP